MPKQYCVGAVEKAIKILNFLAEHPDSSFSEIFTALELSKSTTYQTLSTLEMFHYVERLDNRQYRLAMGILPLLRGIPKQNDIVECVRSPLTKLADETRFSVHFCILDAGSAICVFKAENGNISIRTTSVGRPLTLHSSAAGKALMACCQRSSWNSIFPALTILLLPTARSQPGKDTWKNSGKRGSGASLWTMVRVPKVCWVSVCRCTGEMIVGAISIGTVVTDSSMEEYERIAGQMKKSAQEIEQNLVRP